MNRPLQLLWVSTMAVLLGKGLQYLVLGLKVDSVWQIGAGTVLLLLMVLLPLLPFITSKTRKPQLTGEHGSQGSPYKGVMNRAGFWFVLGSGILLVLALEVFWRKEGQVQNLIEHALQYGTPLLLGLCLYGRGRWGRPMGLAKWLCALTFLGHGVYALGFQQESTNFVEMTQALLGMETGPSTHFRIEVFLQLFGALDVIAALMLLTNQGMQWALGYMVVWGLLTALVRFPYYAGLQAGTPDVLQAAWETIFRLGHGLVPLWIWMGVRTEKKARI